MIELSADLLTVRVETPLPPGSRVRLDLEPAGGSSAQHPSGKVAGLERTEAGDYRLLVRLHSLLRQDHAALEALVTRSDRI